MMWKGFSESHSCQSGERGYRWDPHDCRQYKEICKDVSCNECQLWYKSNLEGPLTSGCQGMWVSERQRMESSSSLGSSSNRRLRNERTGINGSPKRWSLDVRVLLLYVCIHQSLIGFSRVSRFVRRSSSGRVCCPKVKAADTNMQLQCFFLQICPDVVKSSEKECRICYFKLALLATPFNEIQTKDSERMCLLEFNGWTSHYDHAVLQCRCSCSGLWWRLCRRKGCGPSFKETRQS